MRLPLLKLARRLSGDPSVIKVRALKAKPLPRLPLREVPSDGTDDTRMEAACMSVEIGGGEIAKRTLPAVKVIGTGLNSKRDHLGMFWSGTTEEPLEIPLRFPTKHSEAG